MVRVCYLTFNYGKFKYKIELLISLDVVFFFFFFIMGIESVEECFIKDQYFFYSYK